MPRTREIRAQNERAERGVEALHEAGEKVKEAQACGISRRGVFSYLALVAGVLPAPQKGSTPDRQVRGA